MQKNLLNKYSLAYFLFFCLALSVGSASGQATDKVIPVHPIDAGCTADSIIFTYSGSAITWDVPCGVYSITVKAWGGGGGGGGTDGSGTPATGGGGGAYASSTLAVAPGTPLTVYIGGAGGAGVGCQSGVGGGAGGFGLGNGGSGGNPGTSGCSGPGGGGGGGTGLENGVAVLVLAGGGGGAGGGETNVTFAGDGGGGGVAGSPGNSSAGGSLLASATVNGISAGMPTDDNPGCGGGGGGVKGGGCGALITGGANTSGGGGGAGGTSQGTVIMNGTTITPGYSTYPTLCAGCAKGGSTSAIGGNGMMVIEYCSPPPLTVTDVTTNATCGNNNGTATINAAGGTPGYTYSWSSGQTASSENNLGAGAYTVTVTDAGGCVTTVTFNITNGPGMRDSVVSFTNATCNPTGTANTGLKGGTGPYTYLWSNGETTSNATALGGGSYTLTVTDATGCTTTATVTITSPPPIFDSISAFTNVSVACGSNGTANVGVRGGTAPFTYSWTNGQTVPNATNLAAGTYSCTVTDANGCTATTSVTITQPGALTASITGTTPVLCNGGATGTATGSVTGGNAPYTYLWSNGQTNLTATALIAGSYTLSITDANGCTVTAVAIVTQPAAIRDSIAATVNVLCNGGNNGSATDGVKDGTSPYTYAWSNGQNVVTATALTAGSYTVVVTDANGCKDSTVATITQPTVLTVTAAAFPATCNGTCTGSATVIPAGGAGGYTYLWSNANTSANDNGLCAGNYSVVVTDANGCVHDSNPLTVTQPPPIVLTKTSTTAFCGQADGSASVTVAGGTPPYVYLWSNGNTTTAINNVTPGAYCFGVEDANHCVDSICVIVPNQTAETASITSTTPVSCNGGNNGSAIGSAVGGVLPYTYLWSNGQTSSTATGLIAGSYTFTVTDANGCQSTAIATITQPSVVTVSIAAPPTICIGQTTILTSTGNGGTPAYTYSWNTGSTSDTAAVHPVVTTTYTVTVTDANGCVSTPVTVTVTVNPPLSVTVGKPVAMCPGATAKVTATAAGGDGTYIYVWTPGGSTSQTTTVSPAATMYYTVTVSDGCGTPPVKDSMQVIVDPLPVVSFKADTTNGCYPVCVNFTDLTTIASGGLKSWQWAFGDGGASALQNPMNCYGNPGLYNVSLTVTSDSGCAASFTASNMITVYSHPATSFSASPQPTNISQPDITFTDLTSDAYGITQWFWNFGDTISGGSNFSAMQNPVHDYSDTGTYCIKLIDMNKFGCVDSSTQCIVIDPLFTLYIPNAFTPNHDGMNDVFIPKGGYFTYFEMYVFDRWGTSIYHTTDITKGWNGSVNNGSTKCQQDTYVYLIHVIDWRGADHFYNGRVTLVQ